MNETCGLVIVYTGDGKGKTTAALGLALRAYGNGLRVLILQFIKGGQTYGELAALNNLPATKTTGKIVIKQCGKGFTRAKGATDNERHKIAAAAALDCAKQAITSGEWDMIILDEINYAVKFGLIEGNAPTELLAMRSPTLHLVFTGRDATADLIAQADLVTEMKCVKHPFANGVAAQAGIEF